jgi:PilZ domain
LVKNRRSLTPSPDETGPGLHATRRGGARREVSARVTLVALGGRGGSGPTPAALEGWALNVSRGGVRVILEEKVELGAEFEVTLADTAEASDVPGARVGRIVWVQEEPDGVVAGIEFREGG